MGGTVALATMLLARAGGGPPGILEIVADAFVVRIPPALFATAVASLGGLAKGAFFAGLSLGFLGVATALALVLDRVGLIPNRPAGSRRLVATWVMLAVIPFALGEFVVLPIAGGGIFGTAILSDQAAVHVPFAAASLGYGLTAGLYALGTRQHDGSTATGSPIARRALLRYAAIGAGASGLALSFGMVLSRALDAAARTLPGSHDPSGADGFGSTRAVTPVDEFYFVSKDYVALRVESAYWRLSVTGLIDRPRAYTLDEIRALPSHEAYRTLQCISASSIQRMELIGNQRWKGVRVRDVLDGVGVQPAAAFVVLRCADGYHESLSLDLAVDDNTWLVYEMGPPGTPLSEEHGFPLRLLVAGRYGMKQPKHVTDLIVAERDEPGWWVKGGWQTDAPVRTYCRIDTPAADGISDGVLVGHEFTAFGVASAGERGISRVEISPDDGVTWRDAELEPLGGPLGDLTWVRWRAPVRFDQPGNVRFVARATDGTGTPQEAAIEDPFPRGASGYPRVPMTVYAGLPSVPTLPPTTPGPTL